MNDKLSDDSQMIPNADDDLITNLLDNTENLEKKLILRDCG